MAFLKVMIGRAGGPSVRRNAEWPGNPRHEGDSPYFSGCRLEGRRAGVVVRRSEAGSEMAIGSGVVGPPGGVAESPSVRTACELLRFLFEGADVQIGVELADGTKLYEPGKPELGTIVLRHAGVLRALLSRSSDLGAAQAFICGDLAVRGDAETVIADMDSAAASRAPKDWLAIARLVTRLPAAPRFDPHRMGRGPARLRGKLHSLERDRAASAYHYDISNEFYALWLDRAMTYTCAYFPNGAEDIHAAQQAKYEHICRKLRLRQGNRLLDIGCGWGGFISFAVQHYGVTAVGITLSEPQAAYARARIEAAGLSQRCRVDVRDYRELDSIGTFDKVASIEMVEAVGDALLPRYFRAAFEALKSSGLFLLQGIIDQRPRRRILASFFPQRRSGFMDDYVFPDGELPRLEALVEAAQDAGFEVRDLEHLRGHYIRTLRAWVSRLEASEREARSLVGGETYNVWRLYMAASAHAFVTGANGIVQLLFAKGPADRTGTGVLPLTRADLYAIA